MKTVKETQNMKTVLCIAASAAMAVVAIAAPNLRGFGRVEVENAAKDGVAVMLFRCETAENAETVAGKFLMDLYAEPGVSFRDGVHETKGGAAFAVARDGKTTAIYAANSRVALASHSSLPSRSSLVETAAVPEYMKAFGWGVYGMGGLEDYHGWMERSKEKAGVNPKVDKSLLDPRDDFMFLREMGNVHFDNWLETGMTEFSDNIAASSIHWRQKLAESFGIPYGCRLYMPIGDRHGHSWFERRFAAHHDQPPAWLPNSWDSYIAHKSHMSWFDKDIWGYTAARTKDMMERFGANGKMRNWMIPSGETSCGPWYDWHSDYSETAARDWWRFLEKKGVTLEDAADMYNQSGRPFRSWREVPIPEFATFAGLLGLVLDLYGEWQTAATNETEWRTLPDFPGNRDMISLYVKKGERAQKQLADTRRPEQKERLRRFRRAFTLTGVKGKTYLYFFPMSGDSLRHEVSLNGGKVHTVGNWCAIDVTDDLKEGENTLDILLQGAVWQGRIFLSNEPPQLYPNMAEARCRLWALWHEWRRSAKAERFEELFDAMRQADPNAPIEVMAPTALGMRNINRLCHEWGAYSHFTGEGMWFFPWWKRYAKLYGYQGTSELAGPYDSVAKARTSSLRVFLAGIDMHKPVFMTQTYSRNPDVRKWWLEHKELFARMGTYDIDLAQPQVLIYRRFELIGDPFLEPFPMIGKAHDKPRVPWNYDIGRGELQSIGQSFLYIDDDGLEDGKMNGFRVMFDCGNEIIPEDEVARIKAWVERGGVFVAYPFTGRNTPLKAEAWPMSKLTGAKIKADETIVRPGKVPKVTFPEGSEFFPSFAGQTIHGAKRRVHQLDFALETVSDDAKPILFWDDGRIAATARHVGKGLVVHLGSMFWRGSEDVKGMWNPSDEVERTFLRDLLAAVGHPPALVETDDRLVLAQPYRSHDGLNLVAVLCNFNEEGEVLATSLCAKASEDKKNTKDTKKETVVKLRTGTKPRRIVAFSGEGVAEKEFEFADGVATVRVALPMQEVAILNAECYAPSDALAYWWKNSAEQWHEIKKPTRDFSKYTRGEWKDPTQDLKEGWDVLAAKNAKERKVSAPSAPLREIPLDCLQVWGWPEGKGAVCRKTFDLDDKEWVSDGGKTLLVIRSNHPSFSLVPTTVSLNGEKLVSDSKANCHELDVTAILRASGNVLEVEFADGEKFTGIDGAIYLYHRAKPVASVDVLKEEGKTKLLRGSDGRDSFSVYVPEKWKGKYRVRVYMEGAKDVPWGVKVRDRALHKRTRAGRITDLDITELLRFGEANIVEIGANVPSEHPDKTSVKPLTALRLDLYPAAGK